MDHTKTQTFIAFVNKEKRDRYWIDGNYLFEEDVPKIYPYETREQKDIANIVGYRCSCWDEISESKSEIIGIIFKATEQTIPIISKEKAIELETKIYGNSIYESNKKKKPKEVEEPIVEKIQTPIPEPIQEPIKPQSNSKEQIPESIPKKRGRPRIHNLLED